MSLVGSRVGAVLAADAVPALFSARPDPGRPPEGSGSPNGLTSVSALVSDDLQAKHPSSKCTTPVADSAAGSPMRVHPPALPFYTADGSVNPLSPSGSGGTFSGSGFGRFYFSSAFNGEVVSPERLRPLAAELYDPSLCKSYHAFLDLPTPRLATYNIRTFSGMPIDVAAAVRQRRILANVESVCRHSDVVLLQETKGPPAAVYERFGSEWYVFDNPCPGGTLAGTAILVRKSFARNFRVRCCVLVPGYIQSVWFEPQEVVHQGHPFFTNSFTITNVYLHSSDSAAKRAQLKAFGRRAVVSTYHFAGGDWNVISHTDDISSGRQSSKKTRKALDRAVQRQGLREVWHPAKTKLSGHTPPRVSRLDRWFVSYSEGEREVMQPTVWLPPHPHEPGASKRSPSDHFPVTLTCYPARKYRGWRKIPRWLAQTPEYRERVGLLWEERPVNDCSPVEVLWEFNDVLHRASSQLLKERRVGTSSRVEGISLAASVYSRLLTGRVSLTEAYRLLQGNAVLADEISLGLTADALATSLKNFLWTGSEDPAPQSGYEEKRSSFSSEVRSWAPAPASTKRDHAVEMKAAMVDGKRGLHFLVDAKGVRTSDPNVMGRMLQEAWEPIWKGSPRTAEECRGYLSNYTKKVQGIDCVITLADVINEILVKRKSCPGPNGIPFVCYAEMCDLAAPVILAVCQYFAAGGSPKNDFNECTLFFLPKDGTGSPLAHRPIAASNTDNRIIANVVRRKLEGAVFDILERSQTGFVRGRRIEEHIRFFNRKFYDALYSRYRDDLPAPGLSYRDDSEDNVPDEDGTDYYMLFLDFAKAYDSVSRRFMFCLLEQVGVPKCYINIIRALYHDVTARPALPGKSKVRISMADGLKQGCPLSCLLFILAIDPLLAVVQEIPDIDPAAFADDVAVGTDDPTKLVPVLLHVDAWSRVSRCEPNTKKTKLLSTSAAPTIISHLLPLHWAGLRYADSYVYLGVLIGRSIDVTMVYQRAVDKLVARARSFMPMQTALSVSARVRMANTYLTPILR